MLVCIVSYLKSPKIDKVGEKHTPEASRYLGVMFKGGVRSHKLKDSHS